LLGYVRQQAWLSAVPDKIEPSAGRKPGKASKTLPPQTRFEALEKRYADEEWFEQLTESPDIPLEIALWNASFSGDCSEVFLPFELAHIWNYLFEVGPVLYGTVGEIPCTYQEIKAWMRSTGTHLSSWEVVLLRKCSVAWVSASYAAKDPNGIPPWTVGGGKSDMLEVMRKNVSQRLKSALGGSAKVKK